MNICLYSAAKEALGKQKKKEKQHIGGINNLKNKIEEMRKRRNYNRYLIDVQSYKCRKGRGKMNYQCEKTCSTHVGGRKNTEIWKVLKTYDIRKEKSSVHVVRTMKPIH